MIKTNITPLQPCRYQKPSHPHARALILPAAPPCISPMARWPQQPYLPPGADATAAETDATNRAHWQPDDQCSKCNGCGLAFTFSKRRHHCRRCRWIFCDDCSSRRVALPRIQLFSEERACDRCFAQATIDWYADAALVASWAAPHTPLPPAPPSPTCRYPVDPALNAKFSVWVVDAWRLCADAIAIESPKEFASVAEQQAATALDVFDKCNFLAGRQFTEELRFLDECRVGDVKLVKGYHLPCKHVLLVGCPFFRRNHESASMSGLHQCYRRSIEFAIDCSAATLGIR